MKTWLREVSFTDIKKELPEMLKTINDTVRISILRNIVIEPIEEYLKFFCASIGLRAECRFSQFNAVYQSIHNSEEVINSDTEIIVILLKLENISRNLALRACTLHKKQIRQEQKNILLFLNSVFGAIRKKTSAIILFHLFEMPSYPAYGILDYQGKHQLRAIQDLNNALLLMKEEFNNLYFIDNNSLLERIGAETMYDYRLWHIAQAPYTNAALREMAWEECKFIRAAKGKVKKCLALDCDNTLWGGIIGEDGIKNIQLGTEYPGSCFYELQEEILNLYHRGVLLALNSKNNERDVWEIFEKHPHMLLKKRHFACWKINWQSKHENLQQIARDLDIGLDSIVFLDDSSFELNLVKKYLPQVEIIHLPEQFSDYRNTLQKCGLFDSYVLSQEDKKRTKMYQVESLRKQHKENFQNIDDYLRSLKIELTISRADEFSIPRLAQLTQRTNQFNLTTHRYSENQIEKMSKDKRNTILYVKYKDRFGESGIVGMAIVELLGKEACLDSFLLSCRVIGRKVENALLYYCAQIAKYKKCGKLFGIYCKTEKNSIVEDFYPQMKFDLVKSNTKETIFGLDLRKSILPIPPKIFNKVLFSGR